MTKKEVSVVIPIYNEEETLPGLYIDLKSVLDKLKDTYEVIFIDDGSTDRTFQILREINRRDKKVRVIRFRKNFGQTAAISAGFNNAEGNVIITIDADLQNDPKDIPKLLEKINGGYDVVSGWRYKRKDSFFTKKLPSKLQNWLASKLTKVKLHDLGCSLKAYRREAIQDLQLYGEMHRYIPLLISMKGFSVTEVKVNHNPRKHGKTKYGSSRLFKGLLDLIYIKFWLDYSTRPLHFFGFWGLIQLFLGFLLVLYNLLKYGIALQVGPLLLLSVLLILTGIQSIIFGFLFEVQIRTYYGKENRKHYDIKEII